MMRCASARAVWSGMRVGRAGGKGSPCRDETGGEANSLNHRSWIGLAAPGDVERRAVIDRRAHDRQAQGDVDGLPEGQQLHRNQALIVVTRSEEHTSEL